MKAPAIRKSNAQTVRRGERGVTIMLIALALLGIMAMAALSIDVVTLYLANAESQRAADAAALSAARVLSISGITGNPNNDPIVTGNAWQQACILATQVATAVAKQNSVGGAAATTVTVTYPNVTDTATCTTPGVSPFGVNPLVRVKVQRTDLPTFFARIWGKTIASVSATATAEAFNPSNSDVVTNGGATGEVTPVQPRCVKPLVVPNVDPATGASFVSNANGDITTKGIRVNFAGTGTVGERFTLIPDCALNTEPCPVQRQTPTANAAAPLPSLDYLPGEVAGSVTAVPACANVTTLEQAIGGCDQSTIYQCGVNSATAGSPNRLDLTLNPTGGGGRVGNALQCVTHASGGADTLDTTAYPFHMNPGSGNPLALASTNFVTNSSSIISIPIYDGAKLPTGPTQPSVTIVGFLQVFVNSADPASGRVDVTVLNVAGCGDGTNTVGTAVNGSSPVPVRLIQGP